MEAPNDGLLFNTFNVITDDPNWGDEEYFCDAKPSTDQESGGWLSQPAVSPGQGWLVRVLVHNDADPNNVPAATGVRVSVTFSRSGSDVVATCAITADDATPRVVTDTVLFQPVGAPFTLLYVGGSGVIYSNAHPHGLILPDTLGTPQGALIGSTSNNGIFYGGFYYSAHVTFALVVHTDK